MIKIIRNCSLVLILAAFTSCLMVYSAMGVYKKPKRENAASIRDYLGGNNYDGLFVVKNDTLLKYFIDSIGASVPNVYIFNKAQQNIYHSKTCVWSNVNELDSLYSSGAWTVKSGLNNQDLSKYISLVDGKKPDATNDFIIYYVWAKYSPKLSKKILASVEKDYKQRKQNIYIGNINLDLQQK